MAHVHYAIQDNEFRYRAVAFKAIKDRGSLCKLWEKDYPESRLYHCARCERSFGDWETTAFTRGLLKPSNRLCGACIRVKGWGDVLDPEIYRGIHTGKLWWGYSEMHPMISAEAGVSLKAQRPLSWK